MSEEGPYKIPVVVDPSLGPDEFRLVPPARVTVALRPGEEPYTLMVAKVDQRPMPEKATYVAHLRPNGIWRVEF